MEKINSHDIKEYFLLHPNDWIFSRLLPKNLFECCQCGKIKVDNSYYHIHNNKVYKTGRLPICKNCINKLFRYYWNIYGSKYMAMEKICMLFDLYYDVRIISSCNEDDEKIVGQYVKRLNLRQHKYKTKYEFTEKSEFMKWVKRKFQLNFQKR